ncbi:hypothetical protein H1C71_035016 [Ictidomys tridecemlineatus]|nr:hypothetical protein H1C71_035016 [Ictidomys tridecemlineatus]
MVLGAGVGQVGVGRPCQNLHRAAAPRGTGWPADLRAPLEDVLAHSCPARGSDLCPWGCSAEVVVHAKACSCRSAGVPDLSPTQTVAAAVRPSATSEEEPGQHEKWTSGHTLTLCGQS